jgi:hypothetical protein
MIGVSALSHPSCRRHSSTTGPRHRSSRKLPWLAYVKSRALNDPVLISVGYLLREYKAGDPLRGRTWAIKRLLTFQNDCALQVNPKAKNPFSRIVSQPRDCFEAIGQVE